jgi:hypothetical protein
LSQPTIGQGRQSAPRLGGVDSPRSKPFSSPLPFEAVRHQIDPETSLQGAHPSAGPGAPDSAPARSGGSSIHAGLESGAPALPAESSAAPGCVLPRVTIWIDLDNTPHVPFFIPVIRELERRGHRVILTARDAFQVCELADQKGLTYVRIGRHHGRNPLIKVLGLVWRSLQLLSFCLRHRPDIALSHGARSQIMLGNLLRIPTILVLDYEHSRTPLLMRPKWEIVPDVLPNHGLHSHSVRVRKYRGIKEDV